MSGRTPPLALEPEVVGDDDNRLECVFTPHNLDAMRRYRELQVASTEAMIRRITQSFTDPDKRPSTMPELAKLLAEFEQEARSCSII